MKRRFYKQVRKFRKMIFNRRNISLLIEIVVRICIELLHYIVYFKNVSRLSLAK